MNRLNIITISFLLGVTACTEPFEPDTRGSGGLLTVDGSIIKGQKQQVINISRSSSISDPEYKPEKNCSVKVRDDTGREFFFDEESPGEYVATIDDALLSYGTQYMLQFSTPSGETYESEFQTLLKTPPVDSFYCIRERQYSSFTQRETRLGLQFYVDVNAPEESSRYFRWQLEETWQSQVPYQIVGIYDGEEFDVFPPSDSLKNCWTTKSIPGLYSTTTVDLSSNQINKVPLNFLNSTERKLVIQYAATIKQYALNEDAYHYWYQKESELKEAGEIYTNQPGLPLSNIHNTRDSDELILGFFWVSSLELKRVMLKNPFYQLPGHQLTCASAAFYAEVGYDEELIELLYIMMDIFSGILPDPPFYIIETNRFDFAFLQTPECADCRLNSGDIIRPEFWDMEIFRVP